MVYAWNSWCNGGHGGVHPGLVPRHTQLLIFQPQVSADTAKMITPADSRRKWRVNGVRRQNMTGEYYLWAASLPTTTQTKPF